MSALEERLLKESKKIAIVGLSKKEEKISNIIANYLDSQGYDIIPVNPNYSEVLNKKCYPSLSDIPRDYEIDLVNIFRPSEEVQPIVKEAITLNIVGIWLQQGIKDEDSWELAAEHNIPMVMDKCIMTYHKALRGF
ncbi:CoA-binding protein [Natranaerobius trueperi]|uniref:CoA-binding protein n=1 Tax=Natranaerobius trueperi TaxID=759412 RepID=A0A226BX38_9FIRM|nr:CoA-binding protein [Natranaerobius trueperi]OWZ82759.1 CoA-binding protein [Natranaerobius trueperi]